MSKRIASLRLATVACALAFLGALPPSAIRAADRSPSAAAATGAKAAAASKPAADAAAAADVSQQHIAALIHDMGNEQFAVRQQAQDALAKIGVEAFDALAAAKDDGGEDPEIRARADYLVHLLRMQLIAGSDSPLIKQILGDYDRQDEKTRLVRIDWLAKLAGAAGIEPLCRLVRYEASATLSKEAALAILQQREANAANWPRQAKQIRAVLANSPRPAAHWLLAEVEFRVNPEKALSRWSKLIDEELAQKNSDDPAQEARIQDRLLRYYASILLKAGRRPAALDVMRKMLAVERDDGESLTRFTDWLIEQRAWEIVGEAATRFQATFSSDRILLYTWAQACKLRGDDKLAEHYADQAFKLPWPAQRDAAAEELRARTRLVLPALLRVRGMLPWSEREYRHILASDPPESTLALRARTALADMLHELERDAEAADAIRPLHEQLRRNGALRQRVAVVYGRDYRFVTARLYYFEACALGAKRDLVHQAAKLQASLDASEAEPDVDALIAAYQLPNRDPKQRNELVTKINYAAQEYLRRINEQIASNGGPDANGGERSAGAQMLDNRYNQYAWLVGNTEGDKDLAIQYAHKAVNRGPEPSEEAFISAFNSESHGQFLDTLAHCYAGKKDWDNAVKYQTLAVQYDPYALVIVHALDDYRKAQEAAKKEAGKKEEKSDAKPGAVKPVSPSNPTAQPNPPVQSKPPAHAHPGANTPGSAPRE